MRKEFGPLNGDVVPMANFSVNTPDEQPIKRDFRFTKIYEFIYGVYFSTRRYIYTQPRFLGDRRPVMLFIIN